MLNALDQSLHKLEHIQGGSLFLFFSLLDEWTIWCSSYLPQLILFWQLINTTYTYFTHKIWNRRKSTLSTVSPLDTKGHCFHPRHQSQVNKYTIRTKYTLHGLINVIKQNVSSYSIYSIKEVIKNNLKVENGIKKYLGF